MSLKQLVGDGLVAVYGFTYRPLRVMQGLRGTAQDRWIMVPRLLAIGLARAFGMLWAHIGGAGSSAIELSADLAPDKR